MNDAKRAATGVDPITGEELTAGQRVAAGGMAAAGYIPIVGWAGRIFKGGKAVYKTTQAASAAVRAVDIYKTSQKSFDALKTSQKAYMDSPQPTASAKRSQAEICLEIRSRKNSRKRV